MMADTFERQEALKLTMPECVAVVGCGGVGSWVAYMLAMAGVPELWLFDMDEVSEHNRNRLPVMADHVGKLKTEAMLDMISMVRPNCRIYAMRGFSPELANQVGLASQANWIIATTDTHASRLMVKKWADDNFVDYIEAAAEGEAGSITGQPAEWATPEENQPGYQHVPVWVGSSVAAALMACYFVLHGQPLGDHSYRLEWLPKQIDDDGECIQRAELDFTHYDPDAIEELPEREAEPTAEDAINTPMVQAGDAEEPF